MRVLLVAPEQLSFSHQDGNVQLYFGTGVVKDAMLGVALTPSEARHVADVLRRKADEAENATSQR